MLYIIFIKNVNYLYVFGELMIRKVILFCINYLIVEVLYKYKI